MSHCPEGGTNCNNEGKVKSAVSGLTPAVLLYLDHCHVYSGHVPLEY